MESKSWHGRSRSKRWLVAIVALCLMVAACGGGGGDAGLGGGGSLVPFAINDAASPAVASDVRNLLEVGDRYQYEPNVTAANAIWDGIWTQLTAHATWTDPSNPLNTYQFYIDTDPNTHWGRAYRFTGFSVYVGPVVPFTAGTYTRPSGATYLAVALQTWDSSYAEILVLTDANNFAHAIQNTNGLPITGFFHAP